MTKTKALRRILGADRLGFALDAHNALSAKIVEDVGFKAIWAGGLGISAVSGVRDSNELSWTQVLDTVGLMCDVTKIPIILDADTGYGNFNNVRRLIRKSEQAGIAGVCIEDKLFPKTNSFIHGHRQELANVEEFCGKLKAAKDTQCDRHFSVIARVEAFIAGWGLGEAIRRAEAYSNAGADAVLIHSQSKAGEDILGFLEEWKSRSPVVIIPTTYFNTPISLFEERGATMAIWANLMTRASIRTMQEIASMIYADRSVREIQSRIASVQEIFELQNCEELESAERKYLRSRERPSGVILLTAASKLRPVNDDIGPSSAQPIIKALKSIGIGNITLSPLCSPPEANQSGNTILKMLDEVLAPALLVPEDILCKTALLSAILACPGDIVVAVEVGGQPSGCWCCQPVHGSRPYELDLTDEPIYVVGISGNRAPDGYWMGIMKVTATGIRAIRDAVGTIELESLSYPELLCHLRDRGIPIVIAYVNGQWAPQNSETLKSLHALSVSIPDQDECDAPAILSGTDPLSKGRPLETAAVPESLQSIRELKGQAIPANFRQT